MSTGLPSAGWFAEHVLQREIARTTVSQKPLVTNDGGVWLLPDAHLFDPWHRLLDAMQLLDALAEHFEPYTLGWELIFAGWQPPPSYCGVIKMYDRIGYRKQWYGREDSPPKAICKAIYTWWLDTQSA